MPLRKTDKSESCKSTCMCGHAPECTALWKSAKRVRDLEKSTSEAGDWTCERSAVEWLAGLSEKEDWMKPCMCRALHKSEEAGISALGSEATLSSLSLFSPHWESAERF